MPIKNAKVKASHTQSKLMLTTGLIQSQRKTISIKAISDEIPKVKSKHPSNTSAISIIAHPVKKTTNAIAINDSKIIIIQPKIAEIIG